MENPSSYGEALSAFPGYPLGRPGECKSPSQPLLTRPDQNRPSRSRQLSSKYLPKHPSSMASSSGHQRTLRRSQSASSSASRRGSGRDESVVQINETIVFLDSLQQRPPTSGYYPNTYGFGGPSPATTATAWGHVEDRMLPPATGSLGYDVGPTIPKTAPAMPTSHGLPNGWDASGRGRGSPPPQDVVNLFRHRASNFNLEAKPDILRTESPAQQSKRPPLHPPSSPSPAPLHPPRLVVSRPFSSPALMQRNGDGGSGRPALIVPDYVNDDRLLPLQLPHSQQQQQQEDRGAFNAAAAAKVDALASRLQSSEHHYDSASQPSQPTSPTSEHTSGDWSDRPHVFTGKSTATESPSAYLFGTMAAPGLGGVSATAAYLDLIEGVRESRPLARRARRATMLADEAAAAEAAAEAAARREALAEATRAAKAERRARQRERARIASEAQRKRDADAKAKAEADAIAAAERQRQKEHEEHLYTWGPFTSKRFGFTVIAVRHHAGSHGGARVVAIESGGPADMCRLLEGDVLVDVAFRRIMNQAPGKIIGKVDDPKRENVNIKVATHDQVQALPSLLRKKLLTDKDLRRITLRLPVPQTVFYDLPGAEVPPDGVYDLRLKSQGLDELPERVIEFTHLTKLNVAGNNLKYLPDTFTSLTNLQRLDLSSNQIKRLPDDFGKMKELTALYLFEEKELANLPQSIGGLQKLEILNAPHNALTALPDSVGELRSLRRLWLADNQLKPHGIPDLGKLGFLTNVSLDGNPLVRVPNGLKNIPMLRNLSLNRCQLVEVPRWISRLDTLVNLSLAANELRTLPEMVLPNLSTLDLSFNLMSEIPMSVTSLFSLTAIFLQGNGIMVLPIEFLALPSISEINLGLFTGKLGHVCKDLECCAAALTTRDTAIYIPKDDNDYGSDVEEDAEKKPENPTNASYVSDFFFGDEGGGGGDGGDGDNGMESQASSRASSAKLTRPTSGGSGGAGGSGRAPSADSTKSRPMSAASLVFEDPSVDANASRNLLNKPGNVDRVLNGDLSGGL